MAYARISPPFSFLCWFQFTTLKLLSDSHSLNLTEYMEWCGFLQPSEETKPLKWVVHGEIWKRLYERRLWVLFESFILAGSPCLDFVCASWPTFVGWVFHGLTFRGFTVLFWSAWYVWWPRGSHWLSLVLPAGRKECPGPSCLGPLAGERSLWPMRGESVLPGWTTYCGKILLAGATWLPCISRWGKWSQWGWRGSLDWLLP